MGKNKMSDRNYTLGAFAFLTFCLVGWAFLFMDVVK